LIRERYHDLLKQGAILVDDNDAGEEAHALFYLEHTIQDARSEENGKRRVVSRRLQFVEMDKDGDAKMAGSAPYLDYRPLTDEERELLEGVLTEKWNTDDLERQALGYAVQYLVPPHIEEIRSRREKFVTKTLAAVKERLTAEISYWDYRAADLQDKEEAGKTPRLNSTKARQRADDLTDRLHKRMAELEQERQVSPLPPIAVGGALVVPGGLLAKLRPASQDAPGLFARDTARVERIAMEAVMETERRSGFTPRDVSAQKVGYDIESFVAPEQSLRFIEVKGRVVGAQTVTVTRNEILTGLNKPGEFILAIVQVEGDAAHTVHYLKRPFTKEPDFGATSVNYDLDDLLSRAECMA
jgi:hypothetical protein